LEIVFTFGEANWMGVAAGAVEVLAALSLVGGEINLGI
jgi:hypothetical protein